MAIKTPEAKERRRVRAMENQKQIWRDKQSFCWDFKARVGCPCGEKDPVVLDFHHRDPLTKNPILKRTDHSRKSMWMLGWDALTAELQLCDVMCANCHRRLEHAVRAAVVGNAEDEEATLG